MELRKYQQEAIDAIIKAEKNGIKRQLIVIPTGGGKAQPVTEPVLTPNGWIPIGELKIGDPIYSQDGTVTEVTGIFDQGILECYLVKFTDNSWTICNDEHLWNVAIDYKNKQTNAYVWNTFSLKEILGKGLKSPSGRLKWRIPTSCAIQYNTKKYIVDPYVLGIILGDGNLTLPSLTFTTQDIEVVKELEKYLPKNTKLKLVKDDNNLRCPSYRISNIKLGRITNPVIQALKNLELKGLYSKQKFIPKEYLQGNIEQRLALLQGLIDSDGYITPEGKIVYTTISSRLAHDVIELVNSLGGIATLTIKNENYYTYKDEKLKGQLSFNCYIKLPSELIPSRLSRKLTRYNKRIVKYEPIRKISSVTKMGVSEMRCISVADKSQTYITRFHIVTHNTIVFATLLKLREGPALVLAHREELLAQAKEKILAINPDFKVEIEQGENHASTDCDVVIASVPTLGRSGSNRIRKFDPGHFKTIVIDEAHHAAASTYSNICSYFQPDLLLGVTATPQRGDNVRLTDIFDEVTYYKSMHDLMKEGYLCGLSGYRINSDIDISQVSITKGDYAVGELDAVINVEERNDLVVKAYKELAKDKKTIAFCITVEHAHALAETFRRAGIASESVVGVTESDKRKSAIKDLRSGQLKVLTNVGVFTEGFDEPSVECIIIARPTRSNLLYTQCVGRGTRIHPGKDDCLVIDIADTTKGKKPLGLPTLLGLPPDFDLGGGDLLDISDEFRKLETKAPALAAVAHSLTDIQLAWETVDLFAVPKASPAVLEHSTLIWSEITEDSYYLNVNNDEALHMSSDALGRYHVILIGKNEERELTKHDDMPTTLREAFARADQWVQKNRAENLSLLDSNAVWRDDPPTEKQIKWLKKFGAPITTDMTKGQASLILDKFFKENPPKPKSNKQQWAIRNKQNGKFF